jgi:tRNA dimethylallyltransferase
MSAAGTPAAPDGATPSDAPLPALRVICGPTAAGKSALAMRLAARRSITIVSADSRQVYRDFDAGTAKPAAADRAAVPHAGIDVAAPTERYSASMWADQAERWIAESHAHGREPVVVGGTGLYVRALVRPLFDAPPLDADRRRRLDDVIGAMPVPELRRWCLALDPTKAELGRTQLLRAIETALLTGHRLSALQAAHARAPRFAARYLVVDPGAEHLPRWIAARAVAMLDAGWPEEVERLARTVPADAPAWKATGYGIVRRLVAGELTRDDAATAIAIETRQYAKRQRTWFRHQLAGAPVTVVDPTAAGADELVERWWHGEETA